MNNDDKTTLILCPVCLEIPEDKIFQCKRGHTTCAKCYASITKCPECREKLSEEIRNIKLESLLDLVKFPCEFQGCELTFERQQLRLHLEECNFNPNLQKLCKLAEDNCNFGVNPSNIHSELVPHATAEHHMLAHDGPLICIQFVDFLSKFKPDVVQLHNWRWTPCLINLYGVDDESPFILLLTRYHKEDHSISWVPILLNDLEAEKFQAHIVIFSGSEKVPELLFAIQCVSVRQAEAYLSATPVHLSVTTLVKNYCLPGTGNLNTGISFTRDFSRIEPTRSSPQVPVILEMLPVWNSREEMSYGKLIVGKFELVRWETVEAFLTARDVGPEQRKLNKHSMKTYLEIQECDNGLYTMTKSGFLGNETITFVPGQEMEQDSNGTKTTMKVTVANNKLIFDYKFVDCENNQIDEYTVVYEFSNSELTVTIYDKGNTANRLFKRL